MKSYADLYKEYLESLSAICSLLIQFYESSYDIDTLKKYNVDLNKLNTDNIIDNKLSGIFTHCFDNDLIAAWDLLSFTGDFVNKNDLYSVIDVSRKIVINYDKYALVTYNYDELEYKLLRAKKIIISLIKKNYTYRIPIDIAKKYNLEYDEELEPYMLKIDSEEHIDVFYHYSESAGESSFDVLGFDTPFISNEMLNKLEQSIDDRLYTLKGNMRKKEN